MNKNSKEKAQKKFEIRNVEFAGGSEERATVENIVNEGANFNGEGNGSHYENCHIDMKSDFKSSPKLKQ